MQTFSPGQSLRFLRESVSNNAVTNRRGEQYLVCLTNGQSVVCATNLSGTYGVLTARDDTAVYAESMSTWRLRDFYT